MRSSTGGAVRLQNTPEQWDLVPSLVERKVDRASNTIEVTTRYNQLDFTSKIIVKSEGKGVNISVHLDKPLPKTLKEKPDLIWNSCLQLILKSLTW